MININNYDPVYYTKKGKCYCGDSLKLIPKLTSGSVDLIVTSPPFPLERQKSYGGKDKDEYINWLLQFAKPIKKALSDTGSFVIDLGGTYTPNEPTRSLYNYRILIKFCDKYKFKLAEEFFWYNPAKLPSPIEYVNKRKIRVKDAVNTVWWFSKTSEPKADVTKVLRPYSKRMKEVVKKNKDYYKPKVRPSGHDIGPGFKKLGKGAIPDNLLKIANTASNTKYLRYCRKAGIEPNPARFPQKLPKFFIEFLTEPHDLVLDIFSGSNITGKVAEDMNRNWLSIDNRRDYVASSSFWFVNLKTREEILSLYNFLCNENNNNINVLDLNFLSK